MNENECSVKLLIYVKRCVSLSLKQIRVILSWKE